MKLKEKQVTRRGDIMTIKAGWTDRMRMPGSVSINTEKNVSSAVLHTLIEGDSADVAKTLSGIAEIAWGLGWRPVGLGAAVAQVIEGFRAE